MMRWVVFILCLLAGSVAGQTYDTVKVGPTGDYADLNTAFDTEAADLVTATTHKVFLLEAYTETDQPTLLQADGWVTNATYFITITPESGARATMPWNSGGFILQRSDDVFYCDVDYTVIDGIQTEATYTGSSSDKCAVGIVAVGWTLKNSIIRKTGAATNSQWGLYIQGENSTPSHLVNCYIYGFNQSDGAGRGLYIGGDADMGRIYNCTIDDCDTAIIGSSLDWRMMNTLITNMDNGVCRAITMADSTSYNATDAASWPYTVTNYGGNDETSITTNYVAEGSDNYKLASSSHTGADLSGLSVGGFSTDFDGDTRTVWNKGADEYVATGNPLTITGKVHITGKVILQ